MKKYIGLLTCLILIQGAHLKSAYAQEANDAYDPFIDYNEYEVADEEEADINFFRNGRLLTAGMLVGQRSFTQGMSDIYSDNSVFGLYLSYFFDLRYALQFTFLTGSHGISVGGQTGDAKINSISVDVKYYLNTQNITKGLGSLNPYVIGGFSSVSREASVTGQAEFGKDSAMAFDAGLGIEIPFQHNKMYVGAQGLYQLVNFKDENHEIQINSTGTGKYGNGDFITLLAIIGLNF